MLLQLNRLGKSFGETVIFRNVTLSMEQGERVGLIGQNGAGKTTLLKTLCGEYQADEGDIFLEDNATLGYLEQNSRLDPTLDVYGEMKTVYAPCLEAIAQLDLLEKRLAACPDLPDYPREHERLSAIIDAMDGYQMDVQIKKVLNGMGFPPDTWEKRIAVLSGGEYTRLRLAKLLLRKPDLLILDEPTNHLDFVTMEWLEEYLTGYKGGVLIVSHDRAFLDAVCTRIWEMENNEVTAYKGNYSTYLPLKEAAVALQQKKHDADVEKAARLQDYVDRNLVRASTTKMAQSRRRQLEKMEITEAPRTAVLRMEFRFAFDLTPYRDVITVKELGIRFGEHMLLSGLELAVERGDKLLIAGPNGAGKSTLMQVLAGKRRPSAGLVRLGSGVRYSVFEQQQLRRGEGRVIDSLWNRYPRMTELEVRSHLAKFGFRGEDVFSPCSNLSGGELARLRFAEIVLERPNLLFLDEPTNHLDIYARESLTRALMDYEGTLVMVTHDRYLMRQLGCPLLYIADGKAVLYPDYEKMMGRGRNAPPKAESEKKEPGKTGGYGKDERRRRAEIRSRLKAIEQEIEEWSAHVVELENELNDPEILRDHLKLRDKCDELDDARFRQDELFEEWDRLLQEQEQEEADTNH